MPAPCRADCAAHFRLCQHSHAATSTHKSSRECARVRLYIDKHFTEPITLDHLAEYANLNKYYLVHVFNREMGVQPHQLPAGPANWRKQPAFGKQQHLHPPNQPADGFFQFQLFQPKFPPLYRIFPCRVPPADPAQPSAVVHGCQLLYFCCVLFDELIILS